VPISEIERYRAERTLAAYCDAKSPVAVRDQLQIVYRFEGNTAFVAERRPDWQDPTIIRDHDVAKFRFVVRDRLWSLYWRDRNLEWHRFEGCHASSDIATLLPIVDREPIFYG
jgi:hypothetical protein